MLEAIGRLARQVGSALNWGKSGPGSAPVGGDGALAGKSSAAPLPAPASWDIEAAWPFLADRDVAPLRPDPAEPEVVALPRHESLMPRPTLSVVLGSLNRKDLLELAIASVRREIAGMDAEIIVVDGGSSDGTLEWLTRQQDVITIVQYNRIDVDGSKRRKRSWGGFMNMGFRSAAGNAVLMISDDCLLLPGSIAAALARIEEARAAGVKVGACAFYFRNWPEEDQYYVQRSLGGNLMVNHGIYLREALEDVGYANEEEYVFYKSDTDLSLKIWKAGYCIIDAKQAICEHYIGVEEALRQSNNAVMDYDRKQMAAHWPTLTSKQAVSKMGKATLELQPGKDAEVAWGARYAAELAAANATSPAPAPATSPAPAPANSPAPAVDAKAEPALDMTNTPAKPVPTASPDASNPIAGQMSARKPGKTVRRKPAPDTGQTSLFTQPDDAAPAALPLPTPSKAPSKKAPSKALTDAVPTASPASKPVRAAPKAKAKPSAAKPAAAKPSAAKPAAAKPRKGQGQEPAVPVVAATRTPPKAPKASTRRVHSKSRP